MKNLPRNAIIITEDEMILHFQATLGKMWMKKGKPVKIVIAAGRDRTSFYGALNIKTGKEHAMLIDRQNSGSSIKFLKKLRRAYPKAKILLVWDSAPWHKSKKIKKYLEEINNPAKTNRLELLNFPKYAPKLNPQEHVWKEARKEISHNHAFATFPELKKSFLSFLKKTRFNYKFVKY